MNKLLTLILNLSYINVYSDDGAVASNFCRDFGSTLRLVSISILIVRILVPIVIVAMGTLDMYKIVTSGKESELKKQFTILGKRVLIGIMVFFLPTFVNLIVNALDHSPSDYKTCLSCISNPNNCEVSQN